MKKKNKKVNLHILIQWWEKRMNRTSLSNFVSVFRTSAFIKLFLFSHHLKRMKLTCRERINWRRKLQLRNGQTGLLFRSREWKEWKLANLWTFLYPFASVTRSSHTLFRFPLSSPLPRAYSASIAPSARYMWSQNEDCRAFILNGHRSYSIYYCGGRENDSANHRHRVALRRALVDRSIVFPASVFFRTNAFARKFLWRTRSRFEMNEWKRFFAKRGERFSR